MKPEATVHVQPRDRTAQELRDLEGAARLRQLEEKIDAVRDQVRILCEQLDWRAPGCP